MPLESMTIQAAVGEIDRQMREAGSEELAVKEKAYLKSDLIFYGTRVPAIRQITKAVVKQNGFNDREDLIALVEELWSVTVHERRTAAVEALLLRRDLLLPDDLRLVERLIRESRTWALVDPLAIKGLGHLTENYPDLVNVLDRWATDDDFWVRRSVLLSFHDPLRRGDGDFERFSGYAEAMLDEKEFFIRKAIGWVLRETAKRRPDLVYDWLLPRASRASRVTVREAVKGCHRTNEPPFSRPVSPSANYPLEQPNDAEHGEDGRRQQRSQPGHEEVVVERPRRPTGRHEQHARRLQQRITLRDHRRCRTSAASSITTQACQPVDSFAREQQGVSRSEPVNRQQLFSLSIASSRLD